MRALAVLLAVAVGLSVPSAGYSAQERVYTTGEDVISPRLVEMAFALRDAPEQRRGPAVDSPQVYKKADGVVMPTVVKDVKPTYTAQAMRDGAQGAVKLDCVVLPDGTMGDVRVAQRLHPGLDAESVCAARLWTFKPGTKDGVAVPVQVDIEMTFTLRSGPRRLLEER